MSLKITGYRTFDIRFPTSQGLDGSDAMNPDRDSWVRMDMTRYLSTRGLQPAGGVGCWYRSGAPRDPGHARGFCRSCSSRARPRLRASASGRVGQAVRSVMIGGAERSRVTPVPKGRVRMRSGGRIGTRRTERQTRWK